MTKTTLGILAALAAAGVAVVLYLRKRTPTAAITTTATSPAARGQPYYTPVSAADVTPPSPYYTPASGTPPAAGTGDTF